MKGSRRVARAACLASVVVAERATGAPPNAPPAPQPELVVAVGGSCASLGFDGAKLEQDVRVELAGLDTTRLELRVTCTEQLGALVTERIDDVVLEQSLDLGSMPPSAWPRALVLAWAEGGAALVERSRPNARATSGAAPETHGKTQATLPPARGPVTTSPRSAAAAGEPDVGDDAAEDPSPAFLPPSDIWALAGVASRVFMGGGLLGGSLSLRYKPLFVGATVLAGAQSATLSTAFVGWSLLDSRPKRVSPLLALRASAGVLSRERNGLVSGGGAYVDAGLWFGATFHLAPEWAVVAVLESGYARPSTATDVRGSTSYGGPFAGALISLGAHPEGVNSLTRQNAE